MNTKRFLRRVVYETYSLIPRKTLRPSNDPIDVVIPVLQKDLGILPLCLEGIRECVRNKIKSIYIISPDDERTKDFCVAHGLIFIDEAQVLNFKKTDLNLMVCDNTIDRSGWLFQQLIKLSGCVGTCDNYLCIDADHILIRPHVFVVADGRPVFYKSAEYHKPYLDNITRLTGIDHFSYLSYVVHKMCFNREKIAKLHEMFERNANGKQWWQVVLESYDRRQKSGFSEFQLYAHFVESKIERSWQAHSLKYEKMDTYDNLRRRYSSRYAALTFPSFKNKKKK